VNAIITTETDGWQTVVVRDVMNPGKLRLATVD